MTGEIKLNTSESKILDTLINDFLRDQKVTARQVDVQAVTKTNGGTYHLGIADSK